MSYQLIPLSRGLFAKVSSEDYAYLTQWKWHARKVSNGRHYAVRTDNTGRKGKKVIMHRVILGLLCDAHGDHKNNDGLDNRRENLRQASRIENARNRGACSINTSGYKGVSWDKDCRKWRTRIWSDGKNLDLGYYASAIEAHGAYSEAAQRLHGEFVRTV